MGLIDPDRTAATPGSRTRRLALTLILLAALVSPAIRDADSFPLSTYPMYATARGDTTEFTLAIGRNDAGDRVTLSLELIGASDDPLIVAGELRAAIRAGRSEPRCDVIAARVGESDRDDVVEIEIASEVHRTVDATRGEPSLVEREVHARCQVRR